ncbi:glutamate formiminotransferase [Caldanaerobius fijiensis DSM 17918]|uniref:glutamate formimidoyltransferase n=1 Tax=Caldanaerobius fijiensis DSM 17918 TaxID=1121256 RepID=A0A1M4TUU8_9THEO|nr:glutamate formimidoyltransferase [Caldanaerobius fijiensis]SHE48261.1 glutamate formiminotransferase [Caldanaerobius fijiensis DSM 17918]
MTKKIVECVPNFSEGRDKDVMEAIADAIRQVDGVKLLDYSGDPDHNRSVYTFIGQPESVVNAAFNACRVAAQRIDMSQHRGEHPRMGAADVVPLIPISGVSIEECIELAKKLGNLIGQELSIPVYLYGYAATKPNRVELSDIRKGQYEGFFSKIKKPEWIPDYGPYEVNVKSGVTAVGVRKPLIAFNVNLNTNNIKIAQEIAKSVRYISGGLRYVKALGIRLNRDGIVQVSMNLVDYEKTPIYRVLELIKVEAKRYGVSVIGTEIIGLVPIKAILDSLKYYMQLEDLDVDKILETRLYE